jgi:hypothetical protein
MQFLSDAIHTNYQLTLGRVDLQQKTERFSSSGRFLGE